MKHFAATLAVSATVVVLALSGGKARADVLVDSFTDRNFKAEGWGGADWKGPDANQAGYGTAVRSTTSSTPSPSGKPGEIVPPTGDPGYRFMTGAVWASTATNTAKMFQTIMLTLVRGANYNATGDSYVRVTASRDAAYAPPPDAVFGLSMAQAPPNFWTLPNLSIGPWDATGTNFVGLPVDTTPAAFVVPIKDTTRFKADPVYQAVTGKGAISNWTQLRGISIGWRRVGAPAAASNLGPGPFVIDDLMLLTNYPAISVAGSNVAVNMTLDEAPSANTGTFTLGLTALPSHDVTLSVGVPDTDKLEISNDGTTFDSTATVTFTTANYATARTITVRAKEGALQGAAYECDLVVSRSTSDLWYGSSDKAPIANVHVAVNACTFDVPAGQSVGSSAQSGLSFALTNTAGGTCSWTATTADSWITNISPATGSGSQTINFDVLVNSGAQRIGAISVGGTTHTVTQSAPPPPVSSILAPADTTIAGQSMSLDFVATDNGGGIAGTALWVKTPGSNTFVPTGLEQPGANGTFVYNTPTATDADDGVYSFASTTTDTLGNSGSDPVVGDVALIVNTGANSPFVCTLDAGDSETTYPMTPDQDVVIRVSGAANPGQITVQRTPSITPPAYFMVPDQVVKESLTITSTGLGTFSASLDWQIDPAMAAGVSPVDQAYAFEAEGPPAVHSAIRVDNNVSITGVTAFSTWYLGNPASVPVALSSFTLE